MQRCFFRRSQQIEAQRVADRKVNEQGTTGGHQRLPLIERKRVGDIRRSHPHAAGAAAATGTATGAAVGH